MDAKTPGSETPQDAEARRERQKLRLSEARRADYDLIALRERKALEVNRSEREKRLEADKSRLRQDVLTGEPVPEYKPGEGWIMVSAKKTMEPDDLEAAVQKRLETEYFLLDSWIKSNADAERDNFLSANGLDGGPSDSQSQDDGGIKTAVIVNTDFRHSARHDDGR
jgi:hypothetical protein